MFFPYYLVLFPRTLSLKLPVLTSALANSSTSKQKTDVEQGIIIMKCYCLFETLLAYMSSKLPLSQVICCDCRNCRNCLKSNYVRHKCFNFCPYYDQLLSSTYDPYFPMDLCHLFNRWSIKHERLCLTTFPEESWKYDAQRIIFNELRGVWKCDQTRSRVFDISS